MGFFNNCIHAHIDYADFSHDVAFQDSDVDLVWLLSYSTNTFDLYEGCQNNLVHYDSCIKDIADELRSNDALCSITIYISQR